MHKVEYEPGISAKSWNEHEMDLTMHTGGKNRTYYMLLSSLANSLEKKSRKLMFATTFFFVHVLFRNENEEAASARRINEFQPLLLLFLSEKS